jgi:hypothetical protein
MKYMRGMGERERGRERKLEAKIMEQKSGIHIQVKNSGTVQNEDHQINLNKAETINKEENMIIRM